MVSAGGVGVGELVGAGLVVGVGDGDGAGFSVGVGGGVGLAANGEGDGLFVFDAGLSLLYVAIKTAPTITKAVINKPIIMPCFFINSLSLIKIAAKYNAVAASFGKLRYRIF